MQKVKKYVVEDLGYGWFSFLKINQDHLYVRVDSLRCLSEKNAIRQAQLIVGDREAEVEVVKVGVHQ